MESCGYGLRGTGSSLPPHIERINVPMFKNKTTRFQLDLKLTQSIRDELVARGKVEITAESSGADAIMLGEILSFAAHPIGFGEDASADSYNIVITAKIVLRDLVNNRVLFTNPYFTYQEEYEVPEGTDFETVQQEAIDRVALKFARTLIINILEGF
jgi:hypothetical protein